MLSANGPAPPAYILLAGSPFMSPSRSPSTGDKLDQLLAGVSRLEGQVGGIDERLTRVEEAASEARERTAKSEDAISRLDMRNDSATEAANRAWRRVDKQVEALTVKQYEAPRLVQAVMDELERFKREVHGLTNVAKEATLQAAPDVADVVAARVQEQAKPDRSALKKNVIWTGIGVACTACVWPFINSVTAHPSFYKQLIANMGNALSGFAKLMPVG